MIRVSNQSPKEAAREFAEWSSLFSGGIFVKLVIYVDESGTHDPAGRRETGGREAVIAGIGALVEDWVTFRRDWQSILNKYRVPYFHFCEWSDAFHALKKGKPKLDNPYSHLDKDQLDKMIVEFAKVAGAGNKLIVGEGVHVNTFNKKKDDGIIPPDSNPYRRCARKFFEDFMWQLSFFKPVWKRTPVDFFFDQTEDREFRRAIHEAFDDLKTSNRNFGIIAFADKKKECGLQAADMVAYRSRQISQNFVE